jgi:hypothetical protein
MLAPVRRTKRGTRRRTEARSKPGDPCNASPPGEAGTGVFSNLLAIGPAVRAGRSAPAAMGRGKPILPLGATKKQKGHKAAAGFVPAVSSWPGMFGLPRVFERNFVFRISGLLNGKPRTLSTGFSRQNEPRRGHRQGVRRYGAMEAGGVLPPTAVRFTHGSLRPCLKAEPSFKKQL